MYSFFVWLLLPSVTILRLIYAVACINSLFLLLLSNILFYEHTIIYLFIDLLTDI